MRSLTNDLWAFAERLRRLDRHSPIVGLVPPLPVRYPLLAHLDTEALMRVTCYQCSGQGLDSHVGADGVQWPCKQCGGSGLQCPVCRGKRWLRTSVSAADARDVDTLIMRCPDCLTPERETDAIIGFIEQQRQAVPV